LEEYSGMKPYVSGLFLRKVPKKSVISEFFAPKPAENEKENKELANVCYSG
jgi:hypothetical protein